MNGNIFISDKYDIFEALALGERLITEEDIPVVKELYATIVDLQRGGME